MNGSVPFTAFSNGYLNIGKLFLILILNQPSFQLCSNGPVMLYPSASIFFPTALNVLKALISTQTVQNWIEIFPLPKNLVLSQDSLFQRSSATPINCTSQKSVCHAFTSQSLKCVDFLPSPPLFKLPILAITKYF